MIPPHRRRVIVAVMHPDRVQSYFFVEAFQQGSETRNQHRIRRQIVLLHPWRKMRRTVHEKRQRDILRQVTIRIPRRHVVLGKVAQRGAGGLGILLLPQIPLHLGSHVAPDCIRDGQVLIVATGIQCRKHSKNRLAAVQRDRRLVLRELSLWSLFLRSLDRRNRLLGHVGLRRLILQGLVLRGGPALRRRRALWRLILPRLILWSLILRSRGRRNRVLPQTKHRQQPQQGHKQKTSQSSPQETLHGIGSPPSGEHSQV